MIRISIGSDRRILTFPAVHPCEDISPFTLLSSLITLSNDISSFQPRFFPCNKRNARKIISLTRLLQPFLHEIRDRDSGLSDPARLCFSELHLTFQKLRFLLEDFTREGARLRMLMESDRVVTQFRVLSRSIATALDVFPFDSVEVSEEAQEQIFLLINQARKARFEIELDDERAVMGVKSVLTRFENRVAPNKGELKWILDYIGVHEWSECNKEVKFLDAEIDYECLNEEKRKVRFLSSLMGFMSYCRCVVIEVVEGEESSSKESDSNRESKSIEKILSCINSDDFRCPISLELMSDPVTIETGHTYDRSSILKWFSSGNPVCPKTGKRLISTELVPNLVLKRLIQQYCFANGIHFAEMARRNRDISRTMNSGSVAAEESMKILACFLKAKIENGSMEEKNRSAFEIRHLSKTSIFNRSCLVDAGLVPLLLLLLSSGDSLVQENAIAALLNLSKHPKSRSEMVEIWGLEFMVEVLKRGLKIEARQHAAAVLFYLASNAEHGNLIGGETEAIPSLIWLVKDESDRSKKNGLVAIFGLLKHPENHRRVLASGAIPLLVNMLRTCEKEDLLTDSLAILATLAERYDGASAILQYGALNSVVEILSSSTSKIGKEHCVSLLLSLAINGGVDVVAHLVKSPSLMGSLYSQLSEGTSRSSKKASALIRVLHDFFERRSSGFRASVIPQEQFIHVW